MLHLLVGGILVLHGLITSAIGVGLITNPNAPPLATPSWMAWWPGPFGHSWAFDALRLGAGATIVGGLLWLVAGLILIGGALGWLGFGPLAEPRNALLVGGAALGLLALALYFHPFYIVSLIINGTIIALLWGQLASAS